MCSVVVLHRALPRHAVFVAANRDEVLTRPAEGFGLRDGYFGPRDVQAGGTWLGVNRQGVFAAVTNRFGRPPDKTRRSRGEVVPTLLAAGSAAEAAARLAALDPKAFNGFHAVVADADHAAYCISDGVTLTVREFSGVLVLTERSMTAAEPGEPSSERESWLVPAARALAAAAIDRPEAWWSLLATRREPTFEGACVHWPEQGYGTRSATVLGLGGLPMLRASERPPCESEASVLDSELAAYLSGGSTMMVERRG